MTNTSIHPANIKLSNGHGHCFGHSKQQALQKQDSFIPTKVTQSHQAHTRYNSLKFSGKEGKLFDKPAYYGNPFEDRKRQIETSMDYNDIVTRWEKDANGHIVTRIGRHAGNIGGAALGHYLQAHIGAPCGIPEIVGAGAGSVASDLVEPVVKFFTLPELVSQKEAAEAHSKVIGHNGKVDEACQHIHHNVNEGYFIWWNKKKHVGQFLKGFVSRYSREQDKVRSILPKIKGKSTTREVIVPVLENSKKDPGRQTHHYMDMATREMKTWTGYDQGSSIGMAANAIEQDLDAENRSGLTPELPGAMDSMVYFRRMRSKLPDIIEYLED